MTEQATGQTFSTGTFDKYLDLLLAGNILSKTKRHPRGGKAEYKLTQKALQEYKAGVLRVEAIEPNAFADEEERYRLYRLLFAIETIEPAFLDEFYDTQEGMLGQIERLFGVNIEPSELKVDKVEREEVDCRVTHYRSVRCLSITKREYGNSSTINSRRWRFRKVKPSFYQVRVEGFSVADILNYKRKFGFIDVHGLSKSKVERGIRLLTQAGIIVPIGSLAGQTRYVLVNKLLRELIGGSLVLHGRTIELLSKPWQYERKVNKEERRWLEKIYGQRQADRIISDYHDFLANQGGAGIMTGDKNVQYETEKKALFVLALREAQELRQLYHNSSLSRYSFPLDRMLEEMVLPPFLAASLGLKAIQHEMRHRPLWRSYTSVS